MTDLEGLLDPEEFHRGLAEQSRELANDGELSLMIEQAPSDIKLVLQLLLTAPVEVLDMFASVWKKKGRYNDFGNKHLCEILGLPDKTDIVGKINSYFCK